MRRLLPVWLMGLGNATFFVMPQLLAEAHVPEPKIAIITVRYHFGDDPAWANPNFDDSGWPVAQEGRWPKPVFDSDGFVWVRTPVPVRIDTSEPLALRISSVSRAWTSDEVFVAGVRVGSFGKLPPNSFVPALPLDNVFEIPSGLTHPGAVAQIALRIWYPPFARRPGGQEANAGADAALSSGGPTAIEAMKKQPGGFDAASFAFEQSRTLHAEDAAAREQARLRNVLPATLNGLMLLIGVAILLVARSGRSADLYLYGAMIATFPWITLFFECIDARLLTLSEPHSVWLQVISQLPAMVITIEFIWRINGFRDVWFKRLTYASMALFNIGVLIAFSPAAPSALVAFALVGYRVSLQAFNVLTILANLYVISFRRQRRLIAFAMILVPVASLSEGFRNTSQSADLFDLAFFVAGFFLTSILAHQAWKEWRAREELRSEFDAAREVQERMVPPATDLPGFAVQSAYRPAKHVGGDFFFVRAGHNGAYQDNRDLAGGAFIVVGDVSGKGLRAALTVSAIMGALRTMPDLEPSRILTALNRGLTGQLGGGFVTCCAITISADGVAKIANAGHLPPYRNGKEMTLDGGLPLGILPGAEFTETSVRLDPTDCLTLITDGVLEARNPASGELFGFDRAAAVSKESAERVAQAAQAFGQEDDITVLTLSFAQAELLRA
jgi:phosphoserine phosphatase RsbU/P